MILFIGFIFTIPLLSAFNIGVPNDEAFRQTENRNKTTLQEWNWDKIALKSNFSQMDNFISDRLAFRYSFVKLSQIIQNQTIENEKRVIVGKNGWLFLGNDYNQTINQYRGIKQLKEKELVNWFSFFENIDAYLANQDIPLYIMIPPDKHRIYPEFLPDHLSIKGISPYEQILAKNKNLQIIDLFNTLQKRKEKSEHLLYYKTDSHWNFYGAYLAYQKLIKSFQKSIEFSPVVLEDKDFVSSLITSKMDLQVILGTDDVFEDVLILPQKQLSSSKLLMKASLTDTVWSDLLANAPVATVNSPIILNKEKKGRAIVIGDSFMVALSPYINNTFSEIHYIHPQSFDCNMFEDLVNELKPDVVLIEFVERELAVMPQNACVFEETQQQRLTDCDTIALKAVYETSTFNSHMSNVQFQNHSITFQSVGNDPFFEFPIEGLTYTPKSIYIDFTTPVHTFVQIYYLTASISNFDEEHSVRISAAAGRSLVRFELYEKILLNKIRIDPGFANGEYTINQIYFCK
jgi:alginate O-acetyltransferase complex protein AlgJ